LADLTAARRRARGAFIQAVVIPVITALIAAGATLTAAAMSPSTSSSNPTPSPGSTTVVSSAECAAYEEGFMVPLARVNYKIFTLLLNAHSPINYICGLIPSPSPSPTIATSATIPTSIPLRSNASPHREPEAAMALSRGGARSCRSSG
jgi:hypothetical protein